MCARHRRRRSRHRPRSFDRPRPRRRQTLRLGAVETRAPIVEPSANSESKKVPVIDQVRDALATSYYLPVSDDVLGRPSVVKIVEALDDPYTEYLSAEEYEELRAEISSATYPGVGAPRRPGRSRARL